MQQQGHDIRDENLHRDNAAEVVMRAIRWGVNTIVRIGAAIVGATPASPVSDDRHPAGEAGLAPTKGI